MEQGWAGSDVKLATLSGADRGFPMILIIADSDIQWRLVSLVSDGHTGLQQPSVPGDWPVWPGQLMMGPGPCGDNMRSTGLRV